MDYLPVEIFLQIYDNDLCRMRELLFVSKSLYSKLLLSELFCQYMESDDKNTEFIYDYLQSYKNAIEKKHYAYAFNLLYRDRKEFCTIIHPFDTMLRSSICGDLCEIKGYIEWYQKNFSDFKVIIENEINSNYFYRCVKTYDIAEYMYNLIASICSEKNKDDELITILVNFFYNSYSHDVKQWALRKINDMDSSLFIDLVKTCFQNINILAFEPFLKDIDPLSVVTKYLVHHDAFVEIIKLMEKGKLNGNIKDVVNKYLSYYQDLESKLDFYDPILIEDIISTIKKYVILPIRLNKYGAIGCLSKKEFNLNPQHIQLPDIIPYLDDMTINIFGRIKSNTMYMSTLIEYVNIYCFTGFPDLIRYIIKNKLQIYADEIYDFFDKHDLLDNILIMDAIQTDPYMQAVFLDRKGLPHKNIQEYDFSDIIVSYLQVAKSKQCILSRDLSFGIYLSDDICADKIYGKFPSLQTKIINYLVQRNRIVSRFTYPLKILTFAEYKDSFEHMIIGYFTDSWEDIFFDAFARIGCRVNNNSFHMVCFDFCLNFFIKEKKLLNNTLNFRENTYIFCIYYHYSTHTVRLNTLDEWISRGNKINPIFIKCLYYAKHVLCLSKAYMLADRDHIIYSAYIQRYYDDL